MYPTWLSTFLFVLALAAQASSTASALHKRDEDGAFSCYNLGNIVDFSGLCPNINYPITNDKGLYTMGTLYFALASTSVPDDTVYYAQENIICTVNSQTPPITATIGAQVGGDLASAGASVTFNLTSPNLEGNSEWNLYQPFMTFIAEASFLGICMFTEGTSDDMKNVTDPITLAQARTLLYTMLTAPNVDCKTCGRIPIHYPAVQDGSGQGGGILKIDVKSANNCLGKCVGPNSFSGSSPSDSAATQNKPLNIVFREIPMTWRTMAWMLGSVVSGLVFCL